MVEYGKWQHLYGRRYARKVTTHPFGFVRERYVTKTAGEGVDAHRLVRVLNGEPEPEVKLGDRIHAPWAYLGTLYRFSTDALKAELVRREKENGSLLTTTGIGGLASGTTSNATVTLKEWPLIPAERRKADRRKPKAPIAQKRKKTKK